MLAIQALPLVVLVAALASGRVRPPYACLGAIVAALPAIGLALPGGPHPVALAADLGEGIVEGLWLAAAPVAIILGGLVFHAAVGTPSLPTATSRAGTLFTAAFLLGPFAETVTGFGVGTVFALGLIRAAGIAGAPAAAIGLFAQTLIPWGGLGPGTALGAALAGIPAQSLATRSAWQLAATLPLILPLFWSLCRRADVAITAREAAGQMAWVCAIGALLVAAHYALAWEVCGMLATGTVLSARLLSANPPRGREGVLKAARAAAPYLLLAAMLLLSRIWAGAPAWRPFTTLPSLAINHPAMALWAAALALLLVRGRSRVIGPALRRGVRPAVALLMFVVLARILARAGIPQALAGALAATFGTAAPFAAPLLAELAGFIAGTNVGSNSALMPLQSALGQVAGLDPAVLPAVQNGTLALILSPQLTAVASGLAGGGATSSGIWRLAWPLFLIGLAVGAAAIAIG